MNLQTFEVARKLGLEFRVPQAHVAALIDVESAGLFSPLQIRFEGHYFYARLLEPKRSRAVKQGLAAPKMGKVKNPRFMSAREAMLHQAMLIDRQAAIESTSFGVGQVMGTHWKVLGYASADAFRNEAMSGLEGQARLMMKYIVKFGLLDELQTGQWAALARGYNGPAYRKFAYDTKLAAAALKYGGLAPAPDGMLRLGAKGQRVRELQVLLSRAGEVVKADGDYGQTTREAVRSMQKRLGLTVDGIAGPETVAAISTFRTSPDERIGKRSFMDIPNIGKTIVAAVGGGGVTLTGAKDTLETAAASAGEFATKVSAIPLLSAVAESVASGLVAVAAIAGLGALGYAAWHWWRAGTTYEGVPA